MTLWLVSVGVTLLMYTVCCLWVDGSINPAIWEMLGLVMAVLLGPFGTALATWMMATTLWKLRHEEWRGPTELRKWWHIQLRTQRIRRIRAGMTS